MTKHPRRILALLPVMLLLCQVASPAQDIDRFGELPDGPPPRYRIEPSDVLTVMYRYTPEYDRTVTVQPDGYITLPIVGAVDIGGMTVDEATEAVRVQAAQRLRDPEITIEMKEFQRPRFFVGGEVGKPGEFPLRGQIGVLEAIAMAGGFKSSAKHSRVVLVRRLDHNRAFRAVVDAKELAKNGEARDYTLQAGDLLFVPQNRVSKVASIVPLFGPLGSVAVLLNLAME